MGGGGGGGGEKIWGGDQGYFRLAIGEGAKHFYKEVSGVRKLIARYIFNRGPLAKMGKQLNSGAQTIYVTIYVLSGSRGAYTL